MTEDSNEKPVKTSPSQTPEPEPELKLSSSLPTPRALTWTRVVLYGAVLVVGALYLFGRTTSPAQPRFVFLNADRINSMEWPDSGTRLVAQKDAWVVENPAWELAAADPTQVLTLLDRLKTARGLPLRRIPPEFRLIGRMIVGTPDARRTLTWHAAGADAIVESGDERFLVPNFAVESLFPAAENLVSRQVLSHDPTQATELQITVVTAEGEKRYRIRREGDYFYIPGTNAHLLHTATLTGLFRELQDLTFRRLLPTPKTPPVQADFTITTGNTQWKLARIPATCPDGELAVARFSERWLCGCIASRLWNRLTPALPDLLEPRLLPAPAPGGTWDRIEIRHTGSTAIRMQKKENNWTFDDGRPADEGVCTDTIQSWSNAMVLGLETLTPTDRPDTQVIFHQGSHSFSVHLLRSGEEYFIVRQGEKRRARIPKALFDRIRPEVDWWLDRRVFPHADIVKIQRTAGDFRETWTREPEGSWRVIEPLDLPYPPTLSQEIIARLLTLRRIAPTLPSAVELTPAVDPATPPSPSPAPIAAAWIAQKRPVLWTLTRGDDSRIQLLVSPVEEASREGADGAKSRVRLSDEDVAFLLRPHFQLNRPAWSLQEARGAAVRLPDGRGFTLAFHDPHWLWSAPEGKKILSAAQAAAFFARLDQELDRAVLWDLGTLVDCPIRLTFSSDGGLKQDFCLQAHPDLVFLARAGGTGRAVLPVSFLDSMTKP